MILIVFTTVYFRVLSIIVSLSGALLHKNISVKYKNYRIEQHDFLHKTLTGTIRGIDIVRSLGWLNVKKRYCLLSCCLTYKSLNNLAPYYLSDLVSSVSKYHTVSTRNAATNTIIIYINHL